jgi:hypothetical protein
MLPVRVGVEAVKLREPALTAKPLVRLLELKATVPEPVEENRPLPCGVELIANREPAPTLALIPDRKVTDPPEIVPPPTDVTWEALPKVKVFPEPRYTVDPFTAKVPEYDAPVVVNPSEPALTVMLFEIEDAPKVSVPALVFVKEPPERFEPIDSNDPEETSTVVPALFKLRLAPEIEPPPLEEICELEPK